MSPLSHTTAESRAPVMSFLGRSTRSALAMVYKTPKGKDGLGGNTTSQRQYEAQRNAWTQQGRGLSGRGSDGISDTASWRDIAKAVLPSQTSTAFIITCLLWYLSSALSSNTSKALLSSSKSKHVAQDDEHALSLAMAQDATQRHSIKSPPPFPYPVTLTLVQFVFIHLFSSAVASPSIMRHMPGAHRPVTRIVPSPGWKRISEMAKLSVFNVVGHALSTVAISRVPVSTVHTIKALTPLFTVMSFRFLFGVHYSLMTYTSLLPLTLGVMMACTSLSFSANDLFGLSTALASTFIFVAQSIYSKNLVGKASEPSSSNFGDRGKSTGTTAEGKLDKINILYYTSACSVVFMIPLALYYDAPKFFGQAAAQHEMALLAAASSRGSGSAASSVWVAWLIVANGVSQFAQNFLAFSVLALVSPVTYSIASLFKRVFVICFAIIWFGQSVSRLQWLGIVLTFIGLYMYNDAKTSKSAASKEEALGRSREKDMQLPTTVQNAAALLNPSGPSTPLAQQSSLATQTAFMPHQQQAPLAPFFQHQHRDASSTTMGQSHETIVNLPSSDNHVPTATTKDVGAGRFPSDPRQSIPSPPPSRGPSSDDENDPLQKFARKFAPIR